MEKPVELLRVIRIPPAGKLIIQMGRQHYQSLSEIKNPRERQIILAALGEMLNFVGGYQTIADAGFAPPIATPNTNTATAASPPSSPQENLASRQAAFLASLQESETPPLPSTPPPQPETNPRSPLSFFNRRSSPAETESLPQLDLVGELNEILQKQISQAPELQNRRITVSNHPRGGIRIMVDGKTYDDVAEIPDPLIRLTIKMATKTWEQKRS